MRLRLRLRAFTAGFFMWLWNSSQFSVPGARQKCRRAPELPVEHSRIRARDEWIGVKKVSRCCGPKLEKNTRRMFLGCFYFPISKGGLTFCKGTPSPFFRAVLLGIRKSKSWGIMCIGFMHPWVYIPNAAAGLAMPLWCLICTLVHQVCHVAWNNRNPAQTGTP